MVDNNKIKTKDSFNLVYLIQKYKKVLITIITIFICFFILVIIVNSINLKVNLKDNLNAELNKKVTVYNFIADVQNGTIESPDEEVDTSKKGKKEIEVEISWYFGLVKYRFDIEIVDTTPPEIKGPEQLTIHPDNIKNIEKFYKITDNSNEETSTSIDGDYSTKEGTYQIKIIATDTSNNVEEKYINLTITNNNENYSFITSNNHIGNVIDGKTYIDDVLIVNKSYSLPSYYGDGLISETYSNFVNMENEASNCGLDIYISSGFRSYWTQSNIYSNYCSYDSKDNVDSYSARPGHSEHQTGLAFDLNSITESFGYTQEGKWVFNNCYKYGFILRYPQQKEHITGYKYEPWHLRYVGKELAEALYNNGNWITLEEYFGIESSYK